MSDLGAQDGKRERPAGRVGRPTRRIGPAVERIGHPARRIERPSRRIEHPTRRAGRRSLIGALSAGVAALVLTFAPAVSASAHDFLVDSTPAAGSTVTAPLSTVSLTFNDLVLDLSGDGSSSVVEVTGPDGASTHFETGCPTVLGRVVSAPVALGGPGTYQLSWQIVSSDGHPVSNAITFTYAPPAGTTATAGSASGPACGNATASTGVAALPADSNNGGINPWVIISIAGGIVVLAIIGVVVILVLSRRTNGAAAETGESPPEK